MTRDLSKQDLAAYGAKGKTFTKIAAVCVGLVLALGALDARAEVTFGATVTNANGELRTTVNWSTNPVATGCQASGHPSWTGNKSASGSLALPPITLSGTYTLTIACTRTGDTSAVIAWTAPTLNTDGNPYTNPDGFVINYNTGGPEFVTAPNARTQRVTSSTATTHTLTGLTTGTWYFAVRARNVPGVESEISPIASKVVTATTVENSSITLVVNPKPAPPTNVTAQ